MNTMTLRTFAMELCWSRPSHLNFQIGKKHYQFIEYIADEREDGYGKNIILVVYDYSKCTYSTILVDEKNANKTVIY